MSYLLKSALRTVAPAFILSLCYAGSVYLAGRVSPPFGSDDFSPLRKGVHPRLQSYSFEKFLIQ